MNQVTRLPRTTRLFLAGNTVSMVGTGLVLPFLLIYLHQVRGIALPVVGALLAGAAVAGLIVVPIAGALTDRLGARPVLVAIMLGQAIADVLFALAHNVETALPAVLLYGALWVPMFSALQTMIAGLTPDPVTQQRAFAINFTAQNAALGIGAAVAAAVVGAGAQNPTSFEALFLVNAASCLLFVAVLPFIHNPHRPRQRSEPKAGYRDVLAHPGLRLVLAASLLLAFVGYPAFDSGMPAFSTVVAHVSVRVVALSVTVNTALIVATQLLVLRLRPAAAPKRCCDGDRSDLGRVLGSVGAVRAANSAWRTCCLRPRLHRAVRPGRNLLFTDYGCPDQQPRRRPDPWPCEFDLGLLHVARFHRVTGHRHRLHRSGCSRDVDHAAVPPLHWHRRHRCHARSQTHQRAGPRRHARGNAS